MLGKIKQKLKILLIEDNKGDQLLIKEYLKGQKVIDEIVIAETLSNAFELLTKLNDYDVIVLDLNLPDASGVELVSAIIEKASKIPVIVLTGYNNSEFGTQTIQIGASDYLIKDDLNSGNILKSINYSIERKKIKNQLEESEQNYKQLYDLSPSPMWVYDVETLKFLSVNLSAVKLYGYSQDDFLKMTISDIRPKHENKVIEEIINLNQTSNTYNIINNHITKDSRIIKVEINSTEIVFENRKARLVLCNDITLKKMNENILALENEIFEINTNPLISFESVLEKFVRKIEDIIPDSYCTILKIEKDNTIKSLVNGSKVPKELISIIEGKTIEQIEYPCNYAISNSETVIIENFENNKDWNHLIETAVKFDIKGLVATPIQKSFGKALGSFVIYYNKIKKIDKLEIELIERVAKFLGVLLENNIIQNEIKISNNKYEILAKATSDTIWVWDWDILNDTMKYNMSMYHMFGYIADKVSNMANWWKDKIHPDDLEKVSNHLELFFQQKGEQLQLEYRFLCADGKYKYILDRAFAIYDTEGNPTRVIGAMQDITELRESIEAISQQNIKLREIAWTQSHIVRAPLARIMGLVDLLINYQGDEMNSKEILKNISASADELDVIIRDIVNNTEQIKDN